MNCRDVALVSIATIFGAFASAFAYHTFFSIPSKKSSPINSSQNGDVSKKRSSQDPFDPSKRKGYLSWDDYFMAIAFLSAKRSKDPNRQVIVFCWCMLGESNGIILGIGYNGFPRGCSDDQLPWAKMSKSGDPLETKYPYVCHAEVNAILNTNHASAAGQRLYVTMFPCNECAKIIIQSGVSEVIYFIEKRLNTDTAYVASHKLLSMAGVKVRKHQPQMDQILLQFKEL
ncbi:Deoxycytidylate deaminase [Hibiscus syriacus]|uniref:dCMP deaminase n=1 Tax=Hibiscus syriacus TaxID=106335 RepID=A0A6A3BTM8_HIBSY|nr:Deoxycytidylate deaminase [Hibiscus syriacus]